MDPSAPDPVHDRPERAASLDGEHLRRQTGGDDALARELLGLFSSQCEALLPVVARDGDATARADAAHRLKGSAAALGAFPLADACGSAEAELRSRRSASPAVIAAMEGAAAALRPRLASLLES